MNMTQLYTLADALQIELTVKSNKTIAGGKPRKVAYAGLEIDLPVAVLAGGTLDMGGFVLVQVIGDLGLLAIVEGSMLKVWIDVIDLSKLPPGSVKAVSKIDLPGTASVRKLFADYVVARFVRRGREKFIREVKADA